MSAEFGVQGLNGNEIVDDIIAQLRKRLSGDCSLRPQDSYSRGYSAKVTYHLECYGLDKETVDGEFDLGAAQDDLDADVIDGALDVAQEENLGEVRDRIEAANDEQDVIPTDEEIEYQGAALTPAKRKYTRKVKLAAGGAEDFQA